ncbi:MAG: M1 family metallopeptidase [Flavobacteriales bacterium]
MKIFYLLSLMLIVAQASAQNAKPYFQQEVNYEIRVELDDQSNMLRGFESFQYVNNSPDELTFLYIHLWPNAYKNRTTALAKQLARNGKYVLFSSLKDDKGYIDSLDFFVDGKRAEWTFDKEHIDIAKLELAQPLKPGGKITVTTPFRVKIPSGSISRLGHIGQSYQITQWYPKPAVYDRNGWHQMPYLTQGEFYSEFGSFDVSITLPANYVVGATGDLQTPSEVAFLDSLAALGTERLDLLSDLDFPKSSPRQKTIRYVQSRVHDFGWFADKRWMVLKGEVTTPHNNYKVTTWAMFTPSSKELWQKAPEYLHDAVYYYSLWNGDYPYSHVTAVDGTISAGGGMEYPNVTVIGSAGRARSLETVIMHEVGHNWFYGILGSNERVHAWMDEGLNSFNEDRYIETKYPGGTLGDAINAGPFGRILKLDQFSQRYLYDLAYRINASRGYDQALSCHSDEFTSMNYGAMVYTKTAMLFNYLKAYLGEEKFDQCMRNYYEEWKFKHPSPDDLRASLEKSTGESLSWFFDELIQTTDKIDFALKSARRQEDGTVVLKVRNSGQTTGPAVVTAVKREEDGKEVILTRTTTPVIAPGERAEVGLPASPDATHYVIDPALDIPQINLHNDRVRSSGILRKVEPVQLSLLSGIDNPRRTRVFLMPVAGWNEYDKWMPGLWLHNKTITRKALEWSVSPMYSISTQQINGFASLEWHRERFSAGVRGQRFSLLNQKGRFSTVQTRYELVEPYLSYEFRPKLADPNDKLVIDAEASYQTVLRSAEITPEEGETGSVTQHQEAIRAGALVRWNKGPFNRVMARFRAAQGVSAFQGLSDDNLNVGSIFSAEVSYSHRYFLKHKKDFRLRAFYGTSGNSSRSPYVFNPGGITGQADVFTDALYLGRAESEGALARQMTNGMGMLRTYVPAYFREMLAFNAEIELPVKFPIMVSFNVAAQQADQLFDKDRLFGSAVVSLPFFRDVFEVHFPVAVSSRIERFYDSQDYNYFDRMMVTLNLHALAPFQILRNIEP